MPTTPVPDVLYRIELRCVWRQREQAHIWRRDEMFAGMPIRAVHDHYDALSWMARSHRIEEYLHTVGIDLGQDQCIHSPGRWLHGGVGVGVLVCEHGFA